MARIGVIGYGFVGKAVVHGFELSGRHQITFHDKFLPSEDLETVITNSDIVFVCVPTPFKEEHIDLTIMHEVMNEIGTLTTPDHNPVIVIKSTVIPGTTEALSKKHPHLRLAMNPEFLTEKNYLHDFVHADRVVIGSSDPSAGDAVEQLYTTEFPEVPCFRTSLTGAEVVKYMANSFLATKVIFANEIFDLCERLSVDYEDVREMVAADPRIGPSHLGINPERGFGGKCFPKDLVSFIGLYKDLGIDVSLLEQVWKKNYRIRTKHDWEDIPFVKG